MKAVDLLSFGTHVHLEIFEGEDPLRFAVEVQLDGISNHHLSLCTPV